MGELDMAKEIERKFLVKNPGIVSSYTGLPYVQGYVSTDETEVRIRVAGNRAYLTLKGVAKGPARDEYEYEIPVDDANAMLVNFCGDRQVRKVRYRVPVDSHTFEVDVYAGENEGLVVAEVELSSDEETVNLPVWVGKELTGDKRFSNRSLATAPFRDFAHTL